MFDLQAKLQALKEQQQDGDIKPSSGGVTAIAWRGTTSVVSAERVRVALGQALELSKQVRLQAAANRMMRGDLRKNDAALERMCLEIVKDRAAHMHTCLTALLCGSCPCTGAR